MTDRVPTENSSYVVWRQCACYVWPISPIYSYGRCGLCGVKPYFPAATPEDGRAHPLPPFSDDRGGS